MLRICDFDKLILLLDIFLHPVEIGNLRLSLAENQNWYDWQATGVLRFPLCDIIHSREMIVPKSESLNE